MILRILEGDSLTEAGLFRAALGAYLLFYDLILLPGLFLYFGPGGMVQPDLLPPPRLSLLFLFWNPPMIAVLFALMMILTVLFAAGLFNKGALVLLIALRVSFNNANPLILHEPQQLSNLFLLSFLFLPLKAPPALFALQSSPDSGQAGGTAEIVRLLVLFLGVYYFAAGCKKLLDPLWRQGQAVHFLLLWPFSGKDTVFTRLILRAPVVSQCLNYGALVFELSFVFLIFTRLRPALILFGLLMHLGIYLTMEVGTFSQIMAVWYALLLDRRTKQSFADFFRKIRRIKFPSGLPSVSGNPC